jgi:glycosyltransferase involved in cell wall biosynthesis
METAEALNQKPLVSVIMMAYNHEAYIAQSIDSVLSQKVNFPYEIIIGEDGSKDQTATILRKYQQQFPDKIKVIFQDQSKKIFVEGKPTGRYNFMNTLQQARGKYMAMLDGDDYWVDENKLQKQVDFLESHPDYAIYAANGLYVSDDISIHGKPINEPETAEKHLSEKDFSTQNHLLTATVMFRNTQLHFPPEFLELIFADWFLFVIFLSEHHQKAYRSKEIMAHYRANGVGTFSGIGNINICRTHRNTLYFINRYMNRLKGNKTVSDLIKKYNYSLFSEYYRMKDYKKAWQVIKDHYRFLGFDISVKDYFWLMRQKTNPYPVFA